MINDYVASLRTASLAPASVARAVVAVRSLHRFAARRGGDRSTIRLAPLQPPRPAKRLPKALSLDQVQSMLELPDATTRSGCATQRYWNCSTAPAPGSRRRWRWTSTTSPGC